MPRRCPVRAWLAELLSCLGEGVSELREKTKRFGNLRGGLQLSLRLRSCSPYGVGVYFPDPLETRMVTWLVWPMEREQQRQVFLLGGIPQGPMYSCLSPLSSALTSVMSQVVECLSPSVPEGR